MRPPIDKLFGFCIALLLAANAHALSRADISGQEAGAGLREALTQGAGKAAEEEKAMRANPFGAAGHLARKVFGAH